jgi:hypothetical protein
MALQELTPEQIRTLTLEEKDRWWRDHVFKGDLPQLTIRAREVDGRHRSAT